MDATTQSVEEIEAALDQVIDQTVLHMTPMLMQSWCTEVARGIQNVDVIATRYGFPTTQAMLDTIAGNEPLRKRIKAERAAWNSDDNLATRLRTQYGLILQESAPENARPLFDPSTSPAQRTDLLRTIANVAGVYGAERLGTPGFTGGEAGPRWSIQMVFQNAGKVEEITLKPNPPPEIESEDDGPS